MTEEEDRLARLKAREADKLAGGRSVRQHTACIPQAALEGAQAARGSDNRKLKRLTRQRMAETGEKYTTARRKVLEAHQASTGDDDSEP